MPSMFLRCLLDIILSILTLYLLISILMINPPEPSNLFIVNKYNEMKYYENGKKPKTIVILATHMLQLPE